MFEITGTIKVIFDTQTFASGFAKREFVITTAHEKFPQDLKFEVVKDKCAILDSYREGQPVTVNFDVRGNEFNSKYYVSLSAWKIQSNPQQSQKQSSPSRNQSTQGQQTSTEDNGFDDSIPF